MSNTRKRRTAGHLRPVDSRDLKLGALQSSRDAFRRMEERAYDRVLIYSLAAVILAFFMGVAFDFNGDSIATWKLLFIALALGGILWLLNLVFKWVYEHATHYHNAEAMQEEIDADLTPH